MKKITLLFVFVSSIAYGQNLANTQTVGQPSRNQRAGNGLQVEDTTLLKGVVWLPAVSTLGAGTDSILSIDPSTNLVELRPQFDSTGLSNRINLKVDSVKRKAASDSVFYYTNGTPHFAFTDSTGGAVINVSDSAWSLTGNAGTSAGTNFLGTTDAQKLWLKTNNKNWMWLDTVGRINLHAGYDTTRYDSSGWNQNTLQLITDNLFIGVDAGDSMRVSTIDSASTRTCLGIGKWALRDNKFGFNLLALGHGALPYLAGSWVSSTNPYNNGFEVVAVGNNAGHQCRTCKESVFIGMNSGADCRSCQGCTFLGIAAGALNQANGNTFLGTFSGKSNTTGGNNVFVGASSGEGSTTGNSNTFIGTGVATSNISGFSNTVVGKDAFFFNTAGFANTMLGTIAGQGTTTGDYNIYIGYDAGSRMTTENNRIIISNADGHTTKTHDTTAWLYGIDNLTIANRLFKVGATFGVNDATQGLGKVFTCTDATNGYGFWNDYGLDTTANDSATINTYVGMFKVASGSATFTLINSRIVDIATLTFFSPWNPGNAAHLHINSKAAGVVVIGFDPAPNQDMKCEFNIRR